MKAERLLAHYERVADAPDAVARLRRFILDLAVRGKLVPQDAADEPASELLKRIEKEKARLVKAGEIRRQEPPSDMEDDHLPFMPPKGWSAARLATISRRIHYGFTASADAKLKNVRLLRITDIQDNAVDWSSVPGCAIESGEVDQYKLYRGDILIARTGGTIGKSYLVQAVPVKAVFASYLIRVQGMRQVLDEYLKLFLESPVYWTQLRDGTRGTGQPNVNGQTLGNLVVALPPLAEQHRIVAKVDKLMALCDRLEATREEREATRDRLAAASLARLNAPDPDPITFANHAHFALNNLTALTTRHDQINQLRQTILSLAVRGKIVPQDPNDEPASELLKRIAAKKAQLVKVGAIKKDKPFPVLTTDNLPFAVPWSWEWTRLEPLALKITDGEHLSPNKTTSGMPLLTATHVTSKGVTFAEPQYVLTEDGHRFRQRCDPRRGDIVICSRGTIGRCTVVNTDDIFCLMGSVILLRLHRDCLAAYFDYFLSTDSAQLQMRGMSGATAVSALYLKDLRLCPVAVPPLAEQHRIVAKVDELMALCDRLEASLATGDETRRRLLDTLLAEALAPADAREMEAAE